MKNEFIENLIYSHDRIPDSDNAAALYNDAGWLAYTSNPSRLMNSMKNSLRIYSAWLNEELIGLARIVGDGFTIIYIQDILVKNNYRRQGVGQKLIKMILADYPEVRQIVLLTDDNEITRGFYTSVGFEPAEATACKAYLKKKGENNVS